MSEQVHKQPNQPGNNPNEIRVAGSDRVYNRNKILAVLLVPLAMALLQVSSVNNTLSSMADALGASDSQLQWVLSGYALAIGITLVPAGRLGDIFGRSTAFVVGLTVFTVASLLVGLAPNANALNALRILQGFGAGIYSPQTTGLIQQYYTGQARARAFSFFGLIVSMSVAAGPVMSGSLIGWFGEDLGWRASFFVNFPIGVIGIILAIRWLPFGKERRTVGPNAREVQKEYEQLERKEGRRPARKKRDKIDLDPMGMLLLVTAVLCIMLPFMSTGIAWIWALLPLGIILLVAWVFWERFYQKRGRIPMVNLDLFKIRTFSYNASITTVLFLGTSSIAVILAIFLQEGLKISPFVVGLLMLPNALLSAYAAIWSGKRALEHGRGVQVFSLAIILVGIMLSILVVWGIEHGLSYLWLIAPMTIVGFGMGANGPANQTHSMLDVPSSHGGTAGGVMQTGQRIASAIGMALVTAVFFAGQRFKGEGDWYLGISVAYVLISLNVMIALAIAIVYWREGYAERHPQQKSLRSVFTGDRAGKKRESPAEGSYDI